MRLDVMAAVQSPRHLRARLALMIIVAWRGRGMSKRMTAFHTDYAQLDQEEVVQGCSIGGSKAVPYWARLFSA